MPPLNGESLPPTQSKKINQRKLVRRYIRQFYLFKAPTTGNTPATHHGFGASSFWVSVGYAWEGLRFAFQYERNFRIDCYLLAGAFALGLLFSIPLSEWAILLQMGAFVLFAELANTVVEWLVDLYTEGRFDIRAKHIKDIAAGACLVVAIGGYGVVAILFFPYVLRYFIKLTTITF
jgi:diacylglycerol kinase